MNKIYIVMTAHWLDYCSYSGDPEEIGIENKAFQNAGDAINYSIAKANENVEEWRPERDTPEAYCEEDDAPQGNIFEIVAHRDDHEYIRYWVEELEVH